MPQIIFTDVEDDVVKTIIESVSLDTAENVNTGNIVYFAYNDGAEYQITEQTFNNLKAKGAKVE